MILDGVNFLAPLDFTLSVSPDGEVTIPSALAQFDFPQAHILPPGGSAQLLRSPNFCGQ
jgi:hypothetical protein